MATPHSLNKLYIDFMRFESNLNGFHLDKVPVWEAIRARIFAQSTIRANLFNLAQPFVPRSLKNLFRASVNAIRSLTTHSVWRMPEADLLVLGHSRLVKNQNGRFHDPYSESYLSNTGLRYVFLEQSFRCQHFRPRVAGYQSWIDHAILRSRRRQHLRGSSFNKVMEIEKLFQEVMGFSCDLLRETEYVLGSRDVLLPFYDNIIQLVKPKLAIVVVAYTSPFFIEACKQNHIPVIEIQHGMISKYHIGYDYAVITPQMYFPDYLWLWGKYWRGSASMPDACHYPEVGWPVFEEQRQQPKQNKEPGCLFISQGSIGSKIAKYALHLHQKRPDIKIYFKLHPGEYQTWQRDYSDLPKAGIRILGANDGGIYNWLAKIKYVVGGYSTVLAEAIGMGCRVGVLDVPGAEYMERFIELKAMYSIKDDWEEFFNGSKCGDPGVANNVFQPFRFEQIENLLQKAF